MPTIVTSVPRAAFTSYAARLKEHVSVPGRRDQPHQHARGRRGGARRGGADLVSMARPFLADPDWVRKAAESRADEINTCIACNQACLDHTFAKQARHLPGQPARRARDRARARPDPHRARRSPSSAPGRPGSPPRRRWPSAATRSSSSRPRDHIGGQFDIAMRIPGKEEFAETIRYFTPAARAHAASRCTSAAASTPTSSSTPASTRSSSPPASCRACRPSRASTTRWS